MSACSWILTWFSHEKSSTQNSRIILRVWDYLICSNASSLVFLTAAVLLDNVRNTQNLDTDDLMELCQSIKEKFEFTNDNVEKLIKDAETIKHRFCQKRSWVEEYNELLMKDSKYSVEEIPMTNIVKANIKSAIFSVTLILALYCVYHEMSKSPEVQYVAMGLYNMVSSWSMMAKDALFFFWTRK